MARVTLQECQAWAEATKFTVPNLATEPNASMLAHIEEEVLARVASVYDTSGWTNETTTPKLIRTAISKKFVAWAYRRQYSESIEGNDAAFSALLDLNAETIITGIVAGLIEVPGGGTTTDVPGFYPTDASSAMDPTVDDPSLGPARFSMGTVF